MHFTHLTPDRILAAVEAQGFVATGACSALNSYENRVYEIACEEGDPVVVKFYRPGRWDLAALCDEHRLLAKLNDAEVPVVMALSLPHALPECPTLARDGELFFSIYPKFRGRQHLELSLDDRRWLGRTLGRLHNISSAMNLSHRKHLTPQTYGFDSLPAILQQPFIPDALRSSLEVHLQQAIQLTVPHFTPDLVVHPVHGDCHVGNILWRQEGPYLLDFDDLVIAPPVQDCWMLFFGNADEQHAQRAAFFEGYEMFRPFDQRTLQLAEPLRTLRMIHHTAWIGARFQEPMFQQAFPYYNQPRYWEEFLLAIKEQIGVMQE